MGIKLTRVRWTVLVIFAFFRKVKTELIESLWAPISDGACKYIISWPSAYCELQGFQ